MMLLCDKREYLTHLTVLKKVTINLMQITSLVKKVIKTFSVRKQYWSVSSMKIAVFK